MGSGGMKSGRKSPKRLAAMKAKEAAREAKAAKAVAKEAKAAGEARAAQDDGGVIGGVRINRDLVDYARGFNFDPKVETDRISLNMLAARDQREAKAYLRSEKLSNKQLDALAKRNNVFIGRAKTIDAKINAIVDNGMGALLEFAAIHRI